MAKATDIRPLGVKLYFLPVETRVPLKFGPETLSHVTCARVCLRVAILLNGSCATWKRCVIMDLRTNQDTAA